MTTGHNFDIRQMLESAWDKTKEHLLFLVLFFVGSAAVMAIAMFIPFVNIIVPFFLGVVVVKISLMIIADEKPTINDIKINLKKYKVVWRFFLSTLLYMVLPILTGVFFFTTIFLALTRIPTPLTFLALPFFFLTLILIPVTAYALIRLQFYKFLIIEHEDMKIIDAFKKSIDMTHGHFWKIFAFMIILVAMNALGKSALGFGLVLTVPISLLANAMLYKKLAPAEKKVAKKEEKKAE